MVWGYYAWSVACLGAGPAVGVVRTLWPDIASLAGVVVVPHGSGEVA
jgi:hypothetical protein